MPYMNQPQDLFRIFSDMDSRIRKLETAVRFTAPNVNFATSTPTNPRTGDQYYDTNADLMKYWNGSQWVELADNLNSTTISTIHPTLHTADNNIVYTGTPVTTYVQRIGPMFTFNTIIDCATITNFGTGQWYFTTPAGFPPASYSGVASGAIQKAGVTYTIFATINAGSNSTYLFHPTSSGGSDPVTYNKPVTLTTATKILITGVALI